MLWSNGGYTAPGTVTGAVWDGINGGRNTDRIINSQGAGNYAALLCANYTGGGYGDWYLPSKYELNLMINRIGGAAPAPLNNVGGFSPEPYWSSTESDADLAWGQGGTDLGQNLYSKTSDWHVRAIRSF